MKRNDVLSKLHSVDTGSFLDNESATTFLMPERWFADRNQFFFNLRLIIRLIIKFRGVDLDPPLLIQPTAALLSKMRRMCVPLGGLIPRRLRKAACSSKKFI